MRNILTVMALTILAVLVTCGQALGADMFRQYFLSSDVEPSVYVAGDVFFLSPWGGTTPSTSYIEICSYSGARYSGRLVRISHREIALSRGYVIKRSGQRLEKQVVIPKRDVIIAKIYW